MASLVLTKAERLALRRSHNCLDVLRPIENPSPEYRDVDFSRAWADQSGMATGYAVLKAPDKHKDDEWEQDPKDDTVARLWCPFGYGDHPTRYKGIRIAEVNIAYMDGWFWRITLRPLAKKEPKE